MPRFASRRSRTSRRRPYRRSTRRTRIIRRRTVRRRPTTRRRILNVATQKKQDNRLTFSNADTPAVAPSQKNLNMTGNNTYIIPYVASFQDIEANSTVYPINSYRSRSDVFLRGYKEKLSLLSNSPAQWVLRRCVFHFKGTRITSQTSSTSPLWFKDTTAGFTRSCTQANGTALGSQLTTTMFRGMASRDWNDYFTAPLDTNTITVKYDKTFNFTSGNSSPFERNLKFWHGVNKNFYYRDDEAGASEVTSGLSQEGNKGCGDLYIVDFWRCSTGTADNALSVNLEGTLYWHER